ncbi:hypothetical protein HAHE_01880 [Haloferula helveola]|uniref:Energy transducer TonB n=1 Tax=Haloferula helveola TaxID=490095 RepID=A0ABM7R9V4_9BACT|nr:hypothetical protein HAHE_01880 [Haloferula helveola]
MTPSDKKEVTPDELLKGFEGRSMKSIIVFTVIVHVILLAGTSIPFLLKSVSGGATAELTEAERMDKAVREAQAALRDIAGEHGVKAQDLSSRFADGAPKPVSAPGSTDAEGGGAAPVDTPPTEEPDEPKSAIEEEIEKVEPGPELPSVEDEEEDLFK